MGGEYIDTEHLLLGVFRSDPPLAHRVLKDPQQIRSIREQVEKQFSQRDKTSASVDLPLTRISRTVLTRAAKEAELANHPNICPGHLFLALILVEECHASKILISNGVTAVQLKHEVMNPEPQGPPEAGPVLVPRAKPAGAQIVPQYRDLTQEARNGKLSPLIGRERELESIVRILSRRNRCNPVLIGEPGVGKDALVRGLAQKIADGDVPAHLDGRSVVAIEGSAPPAIPGEVNFTILYIHGLFDRPERSDTWNTLEAHLSRGGLQCIATGTAAGYRMTMERSAALARQFEVVAMPPPDEEETVRIAMGVKEQYEKFHAVTIAEEAVNAAISASRWFLRHRQLPDRVIDLLDEAAANVKLRCEREARKKIGSVRANNIVTANDIVESVAARANVTAQAVRNAMQMKNAELIASQLASRLPFGGRDLAEALVTHLAGCSAEEAEQLCIAIRAAKAGLDQLK